MKKSNRDGIQRCDTCGGVLECAYAERSFVTPCTCKEGLKGIRARVLAASYHARASSQGDRQASARELFQDCVEP